MALDHEAIYKAYAGTVVSIDDGAGAFDASGNSLTMKSTNFNLASSTNGIQNKGTKETPIIQLIDKCINMTSTNINNEIYNVSIKVTDDTFKKKIKLNEKEKTIGISIYNSSKKIFNK